jgi:hypothetical protein
LLALFVGPVEVAGHDLEDLETFGIGAVKGEEVEEVVGDDLPVGCVLATKTLPRNRDNRKPTGPHCLLVSSS